MINSILNFFGFNTKKEKPLNPSILEMQKRMDEFNNREIFTILTLKDIDNTVDKNLTQIIFDNISSKFDEDYSNEFEIVSKLSKERQTIYSIWLVEAEVNNGGFNQFYFNSSGKFAKIAEDAFDKIGAIQFYSLMKKANELFELESHKITEKQDRTIEGFSESYEDNPLNPLDDEYYKIEKIEKLQELQIAYIRKNKEQFID